MTDAPPDPSVPPVPPVPPTPPTPPVPPAAPLPPAAAAPVPPAASALPKPRVERARRWNVSLVWLLPVVAVAIGVSLLVRTVFLTGPRIELSFRSADGVEAGKTDVRYKEVVIGKVQSVSLGGADRHVVVGVRLDRSAWQFAVEDSLFWVVKPRIGAGGVTGLGTLLSGAYIAADIGTSTKSQSEFKGLETPPLVLRGEPGVVFVLRAEDLGSLDVGSPVFHRRTPVGRVVGYALDPVRDELSIKVFIEAPYERLVSGDTRFWNASGIDLSINASGLTLNTQTIASILAGGVAFDTPGRTEATPPAPANSTFRLFIDRRTALAPPDGPALLVRMVFDSTVRGLAEGAAVDLLGVEIGKVTDISLQYDAQKKRLPIEVEAEIHPYRLGAVRTALLRSTAAGASSPASGGSEDAVVVQRLVANGLRAQLRTGNLLTGQVYIALDFVARRDARATIAADGALELPTVAGTFAEIQPQIAEIVEKVSKIPFEEIGKDLRSTLGRANAAIGQLTPEAQRSLAEVQKTLQRAQASLDTLDRNVTDPNAPIQRNVEDTLQELQRAARALRVLSDYLQQHPESLLRGKPPDPKIPSR